MAVKYTFAVIDSQSKIKEYRRIVNWESQTYELTSQPNSNPRAVNLVGIIKHACFNCEIVAAFTINLNATMDFGSMKKIRK